MSKPKIKITLVDRLGKCGCHRSHKIGDTFHYETDRGKLCPMATHVALPYIDILRYGEIHFCCPDVDVINVFRMNVQDN